MSGRRCDWCRGPFPAGARRDSITCSKRCRQARHRFRSAIAGAPVAGGQPRRIAYADPPYPGKSARYYSEHPDYAGEVDHAALIAMLSAEHDAWALSTSAEALQDVLALCPPGVRVAAWFRGDRANKEAVLPQNAWEPVIYAGDIRRVAPEPDDASRLTTVHDDGLAPRGEQLTVVEIPDDASRHAAALRDASRRPGETSGLQARRIDSLIYTSRPRTTDPDRVVGAKPAAFCRWLFDLLGATPADVFTDVFPGSGGVSRAWSIYCEGVSDVAAARTAS